MKLRLFILFIILLAGGIFFFSKDDGPDATDGIDEVADVPEITAPARVLQTYTIQEEDTFATVVEQFGIDYVSMLNIVSSSQDIYDFTKIRLGRDIRYEMHGESASYFEYDIDSERKIVVEKEAGIYVPREEEIAYSIQEVVEGGSINSSLFVDANAAGLSDALILDMAEILGWTIDFATEVRQGDAFKVYYEKRKRDGEPGPHGQIFAVEFNNDGDISRGYLFENEEGKPAYYDEEGNSMVRQFLKAPLRYNRITSGFSYARFHPVIQQNVPHLAIDYAAPVGTPIRATADGTVTMARYNGGFGNYIDIRHNGMYSTQYAHLSGYAKGIRPGVKVSQGDVIGYVGSTGWSTGPHLHYQIKKNGTLVNPLTIELPAGDPIPEDKRAAFEQIRDEYAQKLN